MAKKCSISLILLFSSFSLLSCAKTKAMSTVNDSTPNSSKNQVVSENQKSAYNRVKLYLKDGQQVKEENVVLQSDSTGLLIENDHGKKSYKLANIESIKYSNSHLGHYGAIIGGAIGFYIPLRNGRYSTKETAGLFGGKGIERRDNLGIAFLTSFLGIVSGYFIGSRAYVKWNDYELNGSKANLKHRSPNKIQIEYEISIN